MNSYASKLTKKQGDYLLLFVWYQNMLFDKQEET